ncbi:hypothetical protein C8J57DRAFT_1280808 [Mycena rebaudengoi]|nr:hypothetical protein C8J57DRAFT_1280808 [Mycena rebaudengoi]
MTQMSRWCRRVVPATYSVIVHRAVCAFMQLSVNGKKAGGAACAIPAMCAAYVASSSGYTRTAWNWRERTPKRGWRCAFAPSLRLCLASRVCDRHVRRARGAGHALVTAEARCGLYSSSCSVETESERWCTRFRHPVMRAYGVEIIVHDVMAGGRGGCAPTARGFQRLRDIIAARAVRGGQCAVPAMRRCAPSPAPCAPTSCVGMYAVPRLDRYAQV